MMSDVKQAAERLRRWKEDCFACNMAQVQADRTTLADAWLQEHLADDDEAIDDAWWARFTNGELSIATPMSGTLTLNWGRIFLDSRCIIKDPTRGQLRKLLAALVTT